MEETYDNVTVAFVVLGAFRQVFLWDQLYGPYDKCASKES